MRKPGFAVEHERETLILDLEKLRRDLVILCLCAQQHEQLCIGQPLVKPQARGIIIGGRFHRGMGLVKVGHGRASFTAARSSGSRSLANHGFFFSHAVLRHDGCGKGKTRGA